MEFLHVEAGQPRPQRLGGPPLVRLDAAQQGDGVALGGPADPAGQRAAAGVGRVDRRQEGRHPENVHRTDRTPHLL